MFCSIYAVNMTKQWIPKPEVNGQLRESLAREIGVDELTASMLIARGITDFDSAKKFFRPELSELHNPYLMKDMDNAVERLSLAIDNNEFILVYGDYDVDGTTAVTLFYSFLKELNVRCDYYIPDRYIEGYGFSFLGVDHAAAKGATLIVTLDCGIKDTEKILYAKEKGIDVIICDHHQVPVVPPAYAVLDPQRKDCDYPFKGLSGCGVGFKLLQGYCQSQGYDEEILFQYLDLLTISIGADIVPIVDENRILAFHGLKQLDKETKRPGIQAMFETANFKKSEITISDVVFILAPRINAAGRLVNGKQAVELLLASTIDEAKKLSPNLEEINVTRKEYDKAITAEAHKNIGDDEFYRTSFSTVVVGKGWHKGVVGIVASRLIDEYYKPTIVLVDDGEKMSGSARSIKGIDLFEILEQCSDLLEQFGGHTMAAGLSLKSVNFDAFRMRFDTVVKKQLNQVYPEAFIEYDARIRFDDITPKFYRVLKQFAPFGPGNMRPVFMSEKITDARFTRSVGEHNTHLKLHAKQLGSPNVELNGIGFDMGHYTAEIKTGTAIDILYSLEENTFNGVTSLQLFIKDIKLSDTD